MRNEIYRYVFDYDFVIPLILSGGKRLLVHCPRDHNDGFYEMTDPNLSLALLEVSHEISDEAATYFYANMHFRGKWCQITAFVKGLSARRRTMIRSVEIKHPPLTKFEFDNGETLELLKGLASLRTVYIAASVFDFTRLQNQLIQGGILKIAGKFDICVHNIYDDVTQAILGPSGSSDGARYTDEYIWSCAKGTTQWTGGDLNRTLTSEPPRKSRRSKP